ncbi:hypothetical protein LLG95_02140 [bacterium]|nr:hypothetical protein [bacterium]
MGLILFLTIFLLIFFLFTAAQLIGFVIKVIGLALTGIIALIGWILGGTWMLAKIFLALVVFVFFGVQFLALAGLVLLFVLLVGIARLFFERRRRPAARYIYEDDMISRLRRDIDRMRARMENLETILDRK